MTIPTNKIAVYPGSFDPITNGHIDILTRASGIFDKVTIAILNNGGKDPLFTVEERRKLIEQSVKGLNNVEVDTFSGLLVEYMKSKNIKVAIRGLRAVSDLEYEFKIAHTNRTLFPEMETVFLMPTEKYVYLTSSTVREVAMYGASMEKFVPVCVDKALKAKFSK